MRRSGTRRAWATLTLPLALVLAPRRMPSAVVGRVGPAQAPQPAPRAAPQAPSQDPTTAEGIRCALGRRVESLPRAPQGAWEGWQSRPVPEAYGAALAAYRKEDLGATWALALACLDAAPDHPAALSLVGGVAFRLRRHGDASEAFERFLVHAPEDVARTRHLGHAYHSVGRHAEARAHYERVLSAPDVTPAAAREARFGRALAAYRLGDDRAARADLDAVLAEAPEDVEALTWLATLDFEDEALPSALALAARAEALAPFDPRPAYITARALAEQCAARAPTPDGPAPQFGAEGDGAGTEREDAARARAATEAQRRFARLAAVDSRSRDLQATLLLAPHDVAGRVALAQLRLSVGDAREALAQAAFLAAHARTHAHAQVTVLDVLEQCGRTRPASAHAAQLEASFDGDAEVLDALSRFHARRGDRAGQLRCGARAAELRAR